MPQAPGPRWIAPAAAVLVALVAWTAWIASSADDPAPPTTSGRATEARGIGTASPADPTSAKSSSAAANRQTGPGEAAARSPVAAGSSSGSGASVRCRWKGDGAPAVGIPVTAYPMEGDTYGPPLAPRRTDPDGIARFADLGPGEFTFVAVRTRERASIDDASRTVIEIELPIAAQASGRVVDANGAPVGDATVHAEVAGIPQALTRTSTDGRFDLRLGLAARIWATHARNAPSALVEVDADASNVVLTLGPAGATLSGVVLDPDGLSVAGAGVSIAVADSPAGSRITHPPVMLETDARGAFSTGEITPGRYVVYAEAEGFAFGEADVATNDAGMGTVTVRLRRGARIRGRLLGGAIGNEPLAGVPLLVHRQRDLGGLLVGTSDRLTRANTSTAADGTFAFEGLPPGRMWLVAMLRPPLNHNLALAEGEEYVWTPDLSRPSGRIEGVLRGPDGQPLTGWRLDATRVDFITMAMERATAQTDDGGRFELEELRSEPHTVTVFSPDAEVIARRADVLPDQPALNWQLDARPEDSGSIVGRIFDAEGRAIEGASLKATRNGVLRKATVDENGFRIDRVLPGTWSIRGRLEGYGEFDLGTCTVPPGATIDLGPQRLAALGRLRVRLVGNGITPEGVEFDLRQIDGERNRADTFDREGDRWTSPELPPARYRLVVRGRNYAPLIHELDLPSGRTLDVDLPLEPATTVVLEFVPGDLGHGEWDDALQHELRDAAGAQILTGGRPVRGRSATVELGLRPGAYTLEASSPNIVYRRAELQFVVPPPAAEPHRVRVDLEVQRRE